MLASVLRLQHSYVQMVTVVVAVLLGTKPTRTLGCLAGPHRTHIGFSRELTLLIVALVVAVADDAGVTAGLPASSVKKGGEPGRMMTANPKLSLTTEHP